MDTIFRSRILNAEGEFYESINTKESIGDFVSNVVLNQIYNETIKPSHSSSSFHYLTSYNLFAGLRMTHNRIGDTPFGRESIQYSPGGGYKNQGGYIHFFEYSLSIEEALSYFQHLLQDGLLDKDFKGIVVEIMIYNENHQIGVALAYKFILDDAGRIEKSQNSQAFYISRYHSTFHRYSTSIRITMITLDCIYWIGLLYLCYKTGRLVISAVYHIVKYRDWKRHSSSLIDVPVVILSII